MATLMPLPAGGGYIPSPTPLAADVTARQSLSQSMIYSSSAMEEMSVGAVSSRKAPAPRFAYPTAEPPPPLLSPRQVLSPSNEPWQHSRDEAVRHAAELIVSKSLGRQPEADPALLPQAVASAECIARSVVAPTPLQPTQPTQPTLPPPVQHPIPQSDTLEECLITPNHKRRLSSPVREPVREPPPVGPDPITEAAERIVEQHIQTSLVPPSTATQRELAIESARDVAAATNLNTRSKISELETEDLVTRLVNRHNHERDQKDRAISRLTSKVVELEGLLQSRSNENSDLEEKIKTLLDVHGEKVLSLQEQVTVLQAGQHTTTAHSIVASKDAELQEAKKKLALKSKQLSDMMIQLREVERKLDKSTLEHKPIRQALELAGHRYKEAEDARRVLEMSSLSQADEILLLRAEVASLQAAHQTAVIGKEEMWKNWAEERPQVPLPPEREVQALRLFGLLDCHLKREIVGRLPLPLDVSEFVFRELKSDDGIVLERHWLDWVSRNDSKCFKSSDNLLQWLGLQLRSVGADIPSETVDIRRVAEPPIVSSAIEERVLVCHINLASPTTQCVSKSSLLIGLPSQDHYLLDGLSDDISQQEWISWFCSLYTASNEEGLRMLIMLEAM